MATYKQMIKYIKEQPHGFVAQTCWIAHVKADYGISRGPASNRKDANERTKSCPLEKRPLIVEALRYFDMIE